MTTEIDPKRCMQCLECVTACPVHHLKETAGRPSHEPGNPCIGCLHCACICPRQAVSYTDMSVGTFPGEIPPAALMRRSHRRFKPDPVDPDLIDQMINQANSAPLMGPRENRLFVVISDQERIALIRKKLLSVIGQYARLFHTGTWLTFFHKKSRGKFERLSRLFQSQVEKNKQSDALFYDAPHILLVAAPKGAPAGADICLYAMANFLNTAERYHIGSCVIGYLSGFGSSIAKECGLPAGYKIHGASVFGSPVLGYRHAVYRTDAHVVHR